MTLSTIQMPENKKEIINYLIGLIAVTDLQVNFLEGLQDTKAYRQKIKHHAKALLEESLTYVEQHDKLYADDREAETGMYRLTEIFNQFILAIRKMEYDNGQPDILLRFLEAYNREEVTELVTEEEYNEAKELSAGE